MSNRRKGEGPPRRQVRFGFTGETAPEGRHICFLHIDEDERLSATARLLGSGLLEHPLTRVRGQRVADPSYLGRSVFLSGSSSANAR